MKIGVDDKQVQAMLRRLPKQASRAAEQALDFTAVRIADAVRTQMLRGFDQPTQYTLNSLKVTPTKGHNMQASVWFKEPDRMGDHYLVPQVEGGRRKLKGFERALGKDEYIPGVGAKMDGHGNVSSSQIRQILSVLGKAEASAGYDANLTARSAKRNKKSRDYVVIKPGSRGRLAPGVYQRYQTGVGFGAKTKRALPFGEWQRGRTRGRFSSVVQAKGLKPILLKGHTGRSVRPLLPFYLIAQTEYAARFTPAFYSSFNALMSR